MIRIYNKIQMFESDLTSYETFLESIDIHLLECPHCNAKHNLKYLSKYPRDLISFEEGQVIYHHIHITRVICKSCNKSHALLPCLLIPYGSYGISFILSVLKSYFTRSMTILKICTRYQISLSTLYTWIHLFCDHKALYLGLLKDSETSALDFIKIVMDAVVYLKVFFMTFKHSFLQKRHTSSSMP